MRPMQVGVASDSAEQLNTAVVAVWSSLFSRRAVLSRRAAGVGQADACMAVLLMVGGGASTSKFNTS